jgi:aminoglycoside phosphotransferase (APT) family kinase protein
MSDDELVSSLAARVDSAVRNASLGTGVNHVERLKGGHSGVTLWAAISNPASAVDRVVVKAAPNDRPATGRHDVLRQARAIAAVGGYPGIVVPAVRWIEEGPAPFFIMDYIDGEAIEPILEKEGGKLSDLMISARATAGARLLSALHSVPPEILAAGGETIGPQGEVRRWRRTMEACDPTIVPGATALFDALVGAEVEPMEPVVVHGDFRLGNILFVDEKPTALVDWEIWSIGDPRIDVAWFLTFCDGADFPGAGFERAGMPTEAALLDTYSAASEVSGARPLGDLSYFMAAARYKMAAVLAHNLRRHREGRYVDPYQERLVPAIASLIDQGLAFMAGRRAVPC